jgi:hypothetical protein
MEDDMMYGNALAGLASGMAGGQGDMMPCPVCQGTGMVNPAMLMGEGVPAMPPRLAARGGMPMPEMSGGGGMPMPAPRMR